MNLQPNLHKPHVAVSHEKHRLTRQDHTSAGPTTEHNYGATIRNPQVNTEYGNSIEDGVPALMSHRFKSIIVEIVEQTCHNRRTTSKFTPLKHNFVETMPRTRLQRAERENSSDEDNRVDEVSDDSSHQEESESASEELLVNNEMSDDSNRASSTGSSKHDDKTSGETLTHEDTQKNPGDTEQAAKSLGETPQDSKPKALLTKWNGEPLYAKRAVTDEDKANYTNVLYVPKEAVATYDQGACKSNPQGLGVVKNGIAVDTRRILTNAAGDYMPFNEDNPYGAKLCARIMAFHGTPEALNKKGDAATLSESAKIVIGEEITHLTQLRGGYPLAHVTRAEDAIYQALVGFVPDNPCNLALRKLAHLFALIRLGKNMYGGNEIQALFKTWYFTR